MDATKVLVRGSGGKPYACFTAGETQPNRIVIWRAAMNTQMPIPAVDVFEFNQSLYDDLVIAHDDEDEQIVAHLWTKADRFTAGGRGA